MKIDSTKLPGNPSDANARVRSTSKAGRVAPPGGATPHPHTSLRNPVWDLHPFTPEYISDYLSFLDVAFDVEEPPDMAELIRRSQFKKSAAQSVLDGDMESVSLNVPLSSVGMISKAGKAVPARPLRNAKALPPLLMPEYRSGHFPLATAETLAALSDEVYQCGYSVAHRLRQNPFVTNVCAFDEKGAQAIGLVYAGRPILAFRGTEPASLGDWLQDSMIWLEALDESRPELRVHSGFSRYLQALWPGIENWRRSLPEGLGGWLLTGHSLGGAMAILAAWQLHNNGQRIESVVTFGAPPVGNSGFRLHCESEQLAARVWRVVAGPDIVPRLLPPPVGYCHFGTEIPVLEDWHSDQTWYAQCFGSYQNLGWLTVASFFHQTFPAAATAVQLLGPLAFSVGRGAVAHMREFGYSQSLSKAMAQFAHQALAKASPEYPLKASNSELIKRHTDLARLRICRA